MGDKIEIVTCLFIKDDKILMTLRSSGEPNYSGKWTFSAGRIEEGETPEDTMKREMLEELNVIVDDYTKKGIIDDTDPSSGDDYRHHVFLISGWSPNIIGSTEAVEIGWFLPEQIASIDTFPVTFRLLKCAGLR